MLPVHEEGEEGLGKHLRRLMNVGTCLQGWPKGGQPIESSPAGEGWRACSCDSLRCPVTSTNHAEEKSPGLSLFEILAGLLCDLVSLPLHLPLCRNGAPSPFSQVAPGNPGDLTKLWAQGCNVTCFPGGFQEPAAGLPCWGQSWRQGAHAPQPGHWQVRCQAQGPCALSKASGQAGRQPRTSDSWEGLIAPQWLGSTSLPCR